jgi:hypothetical protein
MAFGDVGGPVTELIATMRTPASGSVDIRKGDALCLTGKANYEVTNGAPHARVIGQAMADCDRNGAAIPVRLRGVCEFVYEPTQYNTHPAPGNFVTVVAGKQQGRVAFNYECGDQPIFAVDTTKQTVMVLL